jgi:uncharacterized protein (DUF433 family)
MTTRLLRKSGLPSWTRIELCSWLLAEVSSTRSRSLLFEASKAHNPFVQLKDALDRITVDPAQLNGQPCIRSLRISVRRVLEAMSIYADRAEVLREYPELEEEDLRQALAYAALAVEDRVIDLPRAS